MSPSSSFSLTWLGHSTFRLTASTGTVVLIDPWVAGNPACPPALKALDRVDLMLITHGHGDHIGDAVALAKKHRCDVVAVYETCLWLKSKGVERTRPMNKGGTQELGDVKVTMVSADHSCGIADVDDRGRDVVVYGGEPCGYVVHLPGGARVYHAGDTNVFGDMRIIGELYRPDLALIPIGDLYTMSPREAAYAIRLLGVKRVVPMHFATFDALTGTPEALRRETAGIDGLEIVALEPGGTLG
ncbi:MAG: metal-dependent hydrolase [Acidobacteria bacterium]|nr:metal-dependent hydrolase [Acidobacteriota bacterium]